MTKYKSSLSLMILTFLFGILVGRTQAQTWQDVTGNIPGGIPIVQNGGPLASDGTNLYVNTGSGVVRTTNGSSFTQTADIEGGSWRFVKVVNGEVWVGDAIASGHYTYLWRSSDLGATWNGASNGMPGEVDIISLEDVTYDEDSGTYWAASRIGGVYRSNDGTNWTHNRVGLPQVPFVGYSTGEFVIAEGGDAMVAMIGDGTIVPAGIYRTQNDGASFSRLPDVIPGDPGNFVRIGDRILYTSSGVNLITGGLFITEDFGDTWTFQNQWLKTSYSMSTDGTTVFAVIGGNIFYSGNQGDSWDRLDPSGLTPGWNAVAIEKVGNYLYLFSSENNQGKIFRLDVSGMSFDPSTQVTLNPVGGTVIEGNVIALEGDAIGNGPVSYQWYRDGVAIQGATEKTLTLDPIALEDDGFYTFTATAGGETVESEGAFVIVKARSIGTVDDQFDLRFPPFNLAVTQIAYDALIDTEGNLWVTGRLRSSGNRVLKVNPLSGEILAEAATTAEGRSLAEDSMGKIWAGTNNAWLHRISKDGTIDFTVDINLGAGSGRVNKIIPYGDEGKVFIAGLFDTVGGVLTGPVALLNHDGTLDTSFTFDSANLATTDIADIDVFPDGSLIVVTNTFTTNPVYKLNSNGSVDTNWWLGGKRDGMEQGNVNGDTNAVRILPSGQFLIGFRHTNGTNTNVITNKANLMRFHADGTWDDTFNPEGTGPGGEVFAIEMAPDGKIVIVGDFDGYSDATNTSANRNITRLLANGTVDTYWNPGAEGNRGDVLGASFDDRGNVFIASDHTWYNNVNLNRVLKLVGDVASLDILGDPQSLTLDLGETATFQVFTFGTTAVSYQWRKDGVEIPGANSDILELTNIDDGDDGYYDVVVSNESGQLISQAARLMTISIPKFVAQPEAQNILVGDELTLSVEAIGLGDLTYQWFFEGEEIAGATGASYMIAFPSIANSGSYSVEVTGSAGTSTSSQALVYVEPFAGALDLSFKVNPGFNQAVYDVLELEDGSLIVGGAFTQYNGVAKSHIAKVDKFGNLDADWPQVNAPNVWVRTIQQLDNGQLLLGGPFSSGNGWEWGIVRMNLDGTIDADFNSAGSGFNNNAGVWQLAVQEDGKILVMVDRTYNANPTYNDETVADVFRINADGSIDDTFVQVDTDVAPKGMLLLRNGKVVVYGNFNTVNGESVARLVRLNANGTIDSSFALGAAPNQQVLSVDETTDGKLILGGWFQSLGGYNRQFLALLNADGSVNEAFDSSPEGPNTPLGQIEAVSALLNGEFLVVGNFLGWESGNQYPYRIATVNELGEKTGFTNDSHWGFASNPGATKILDAPGSAFIAGTNLNYHTQSVGGLFKMHLDAMDLVFLEQPEDQYVEAGQTATFVADVLGTTTVGYQWYKDGVAVQGANGATLEVTNAQESDVGIYTLEVVNASGSRVSAPVILYILAEPEILSDPVGNVANSGSTISLTADGVGAMPLSIQWYKNDVAIDGATEATLLLQGVLAEDAGLYHAVFTNNLGSASTTKVAVSVQYGQAGVDPNFTPGYFGSPAIPFVGVAPDGSYRIAGGFTGNGLSSYYTAINDNGSINSTINLQLFSGFFLGSGGIQEGDFNAHGDLLGMSGSRVFRVATDGKADESYDTTWQTLPNYTSPKVKHLDDGTAFVVDMNYLVKINSDGTKDDTFNNGGAGPVGDVEGIAVSETGKLFLYGTFTSYNGVNLSGMALLNEDGTLDNSFDPGAGVSGSQFTSPIQMAEFAPDGDIYIGGNFTTYKGEAVNYLFRVDANGTLDTGFAPGVFASNFSQVTAMLMLSDGTFLVRGSFTQFNGLSQTYVVCLDDTGAKVDHSVGTGVNGSINDWQLEADGSIIMVGSFFSPKNRMMRINPTPPALEIVAEPSPFSIETGQYGRLEVAAVGQGPLSFQWKKDGVAIDGETNFYIEFDPAELADRGTYTVDVTNGVDTATSVGVSPTIEGTEPTAFDLWVIAQGVPESFRKTTDDPDGDNIPNAAEYALGTDPMVANQTGAPEPEFVTGTELGLGNNDLYLTLTVRVKRDVPGVTVTPRASADLRTINTGAANVVVLSGPVADGDFDIYEYRSAFSVNAGSPQGFMDVLVTTF